MVWETRGFFQLLKKQGYEFSHQGNGRSFAGSDAPPLTTGTTVLALKYQDGVLVAGDRRATAGNLVMYDRTDKVLEIDRYSVLAIAGVPATAFEMARVLEHSFKYYRRSQLQDLSFEGKLRALSTLLKNNAPAALAGTGAVVPIFAGYDFQDGAGKIFSTISWVRNLRAWIMRYLGQAPRPFGESCFISINGALAPLPRIPRAMP